MIENHSFETKGHTCLYLLSLAKRSMGYIERLESAFDSVQIFDEAKTQHAHAIDGSIDLRDISLSFVDVRSDLLGDNVIVLEGSNLQHVGFIDQKIPGSNFSNSVLDRCNLSRSDFRESNFFGSRFIRVNVNRAVFRNCDMREVKEMSFMYDSFYEADWRGCDFTGTDLSWVDHVEIEKRPGFFDGCSGVVLGDFRPLIYSEN